MALQIIWTVDADYHFNDILEYWSMRNGTKTYSQKLYQAVTNAIMMLSKYPESGKLTEKTFVRVKIVRDYYLFYSFNDTHLYIVGFCDMRRNPNYIEKLIN